MITIKTTATKVFDLYRFQLLPITQHVTEDLYRKPLTVDQLKERKNKLFEEVLQNFPKMSHRTLNIKHVKVLSDGDWFAYKIGVQKSVERESEHFIKERIESWPHVTVFINNNKNVQLIGVSRNPRAFSDSHVVADLIKESLSDNLAKMMLSLHVEAIFDKQEFWSLVQQYEGLLTSVRFELISPNMANISKALTVDLRSINLETNSHRTCLELNAAKDAALEIKKGIGVVDGLVDYAAEGGGDISLRVKGLKKTIRTSKTTRTIEIDEIAVENLSAEELQKMLFMLEINK